MNSVYKDNLLKYETSINPIILICIFLGISYGAYACFKGFINITELHVKLIALFGFIMGLSYLLSIIHALIEGRRIVSSIIFFNDRVEIINILRQKIKINEIDISSVYDKNTKWFLKPSETFQSQKKSLMIILKDNCFYRISPNMERIEELKSELEKIIEKNQAR